MNHPLPKPVQMALDGMSAYSLREPVEYKKYSKLYSVADVVQATSLGEPAAWPPNFTIGPRLFGMRLTGDEAYIPAVVESKVKTLMEEIDRVFYDNSYYEYRDGSVPPIPMTQKERPVRYRIIEWLPMELISLPHASEYEYALRIVLNAEYRV